MVWSNELEGDATQARLEAVQKKREALEATVKALGHEAAARAAEAAAAAEDLAAARREEQGVQARARAAASVSAMASSSSKAQVAQLEAQLADEQRIEAVLREESTQVAEELVATREVHEQTQAIRLRRAEEFEEFNRHAAAANAEAEQAEIRHRACKSMTDELAARVQTLRDSKKRRGATASVLKDEVAACKKWYERRRLRWFTGLALAEIAACFLLVLARMF